MALFFIADTAVPDFNRDLHVIADTPGEAIQAWRNHWEDMVEDVEEEPERVFLIDPAAPSGPLGWHSETCKQVAGTIED